MTTSGVGARAAPFALAPAHRASREAEEAPDRRRLHRVPTQKDVAKKTHAPGPSTAVPKRRDVTLRSFMHIADRAAMDHSHDLPHDPDPLPSPKKTGSPPPIGRLTPALDDVAPARALTRSGSRSASLAPPSPPPPRLHPDVVARRDAQARHAQDLERLLERTRNKSLSRSHKLRVEESAIRSTYARIADRNEPEVWPGTGPRGTWTGKGMAFGAGAPADGKGFHKLRAQATGLCLTTQHHPWGECPPLDPSLSCHHNHISSHQTHPKSAKQDRQSKTSTQNNIQRNKSIHHTVQRITTPTHNPTDSDWAPEKFTWECVGGGGLVPPFQPPTPSEGAKGGLSFFHVFASYYEALVSHHHAAELPCHLLEPFVVCRILRAKLEMQN